MSGLNGDWYEALKGEFSKPYYRKLFETVNEEYRTKLIFPPAQDSNVRISDEKNFPACR